MACCLMHFKIGLAFAVSPTNLAKVAVANRFSHHFPPQLPALWRVQYFVNWDCHVSTLHLFILLAEPMIVPLFFKIGVLEAHL